MFGCAQREPAAGREVERPRRLADDGQRRRKARAAETLLEGPQRFIRPPCPDDDQPARINPVGRETGPKGKAGLGNRHFLFDPEDGLLAERTDPAENTGGKAGQGAGAAGLVTAEFVKGSEGKAPAQSVIDGLDAKGHPVFRSAPRKRG